MGTRAGREALRAGNCEVARAGDGGEMAGMGSWVVLAGSKEKGRRWSEMGEMGDSAPGAARSTGGLGSGFSDGVSMGDGVGEGVIGLGLEALEKRLKPVLLLPRECLAELGREDTMVSSLRRGDGPAGRPVNAGFGLSICSETT